MARGLLCGPGTARLTRGTNPPMMKLSFALLVASVATLAGCDLYFGNGHDGHGDGGKWNYCGSDGYYTCDGDNCEWQGATCPAGVGGGSSTAGGSGYECHANS